MHARMPFPVPACNQRLQPPGRSIQVTAQGMVLFMPLQLLLGNILFVNPDPNWTFSQMGTYEGVAQLFTVQATVLPAWVHYIAFDL